MTSSIVWFIDQLSKVIYNPLEIDGYTKAIQKIYSQAIEMHKQEILDAFEEGSSDGYDGWGSTNKEKYYNETYKQ